MSLRIKRYGWKPSPPDKRDLKLKLVHPHTLDVTFPPSLDLRPGFPFPPFDQKNLGSCTANSTVGAITFDQQKQALPPVMMSRLFLYWWSRYTEGGLDQTQVDSGAMLRDVFKAYNTYGICSEDEWGYSDDPTQLALRPPDLVVTDAALHKPLRYMAVDQDEVSMKQALVSGYVIVVGFTVYPSFEGGDVASTGLAPLPGTDDLAQGPIGGHAVVCCGYDNAQYDNTGGWLMRNSWGPGWGLGGYFWLPNRYLLDPDLSDDFWVLEQVS